MICICTCCQNIPYWLMLGSPHRFRNNHIKLKINAQYQQFNRNLTENDKWQKIVWLTLSFWNTKRFIFWRIEICFTLTFVIFAYCMFHKTFLKFITESIDTHDTSTIFFKVIFIANAFSFATNDIFRFVTIWILWTLSTQNWN